MLRNWWGAQEQTVAVVELRPFRWTATSESQQRRITMASRNMTALLAMLAVAGWQNRDRLRELLAGVSGQKPTGPSSDANPGTHPSNRGAAGGLLGGLFNGGVGSDKTLSGGLGDLLGTFTGNGHGSVANSWVQTGPNQEVDEHQLSNALGGDTIDQLALETGLSRDELLYRLKMVLPTAVDTLTPEGRLPSGRRNVVSASYYFRVWEHHPQ